MFDLAIYGRAQDALPLLLASGFFFTALAAAGCLLLPHEPGNALVQTMLRQEDEFIYGPDNEVLPADPATALRAIVFTGFLFALAALAALPALIFDRLLTPNTKYSFWVWFFWIPVGVVVLAVKSQRLPELIKKLAK